MTLDRVSHLGRLAIVQRVIAAHRALQLGELPDHACQEIGFREPRGALRQRRVGPEQTCDPSGQQLHAFGALELGAKLVVVDDLA